MEEIDDDQVQRQAPALVFPRHGEKLLLGLVTELALPEAQAVFGHHGYGAGDRGVGGFDLPGCVPGHKPVIQPLGGIGLEAHHVFAQHGPAHGGVVPQEAVPQRGEEEGNRNLGVALGQLQIRTLQIQIGLLVLAHAVELLFRVEGLKAGGEAVVAAGNGFEFPGLHLDGAAIGIEGVPAVAVVFLQKYFAGLVVSGQLAAPAEVDGQLAVGEAAAMFGLADFGPGAVGLRQGPVLGGHLGLLPGPDADGVVAPGLDAKAFAAKAVEQGVVQ